jgi:hypothetical protein
MLNEPDEPSMFDEIQTVVFASPEKIGKVFCVLDENLRLCLVCEEAFTRQGAAEHARTACYFPEPRNDGGSAQKPTNHPSPSNHPSRVDSEPQHDSRACNQNNQGTPVHNGCSS